MRFLALALFSILFAYSYPAHSQRPGGPPPAAFDACSAKSANSDCSFDAPHGTVRGTCRNVRASQQKGLVCAPGNRPGAGQSRGPERRGQPNANRQNDNRRAGRSGSLPFGYDAGAPFAKAIRLTNKLTDTSQGTCFDESRVIECPAKGEKYYGQDAHYQGRLPAYRNNSDGTVSDLNTGLMWQKAHNAERQNYNDAEQACSDLTLARKSDWRLPNLKELFSIADFRGSQGRHYFIDDKFFDFSLPDKSILEGDRFASTHRVEMMGQTWSSTIYAGDHYGRTGVEGAFFFNYLDGHIKQAPTRGRSSLFYRCVRGPKWGDNDFRDNGNGTVTDKASGLMWQQSDDNKTRDWPEALNYCENLDLAGYRDWRLPNVKTLQHIVDYRDYNPALDTDYLKQTDKAGWFWSSTTHGDNIKMASYVCFGKCVSVDGVDVHGAGAQRSDPKTGNPSDFTSLGGQRDEVRINNYARCVRDAG
ncbi:MAG: DUF1566 domain-containing protein [Rhodospirillaceae bacterium]|jgi:hypothetical protein|nr:DUF1566 domain-containing protein [Rhodospirillaceae bacterium]MBT4941371.1 DUF1566 domain-containing protein [Rhodospirillaceae bacterium]MBT5938480.1 DUF1566 domain-containing protein [Rhodospirillaceae bacterium]MBT7266939.1 DUF1566 domain-containing protein [Rhodospirillaceae bacterium]